MAYDENLVDRLREALVDVPHVEEKKMFRGVTFMVNDKMCICVSSDNLLCRIGPEKAAEMAETDGCSMMVMNGRVMKDYVYVSREGFSSPKDFERWVTLSLAFNSEAKASPKKKKKAAQ
jgi:TfoX/Sxy family transcriptional regulator of competence genes